jgi:hypothetical protein
MLVLFSKLLCITESYITSVCNSEQQITEVTRINTILRGADYSVCYCWYSFGYEGTDMIYTTLKKATIREIFLLNL